MVRLSAHYLILILQLLRSGAAQPTVDSSASAKQMLAILERRQNSCPSSAPLSCQAVDSKLPNNFCCPTGTACVSLDSSTTALCCPNGSTCSTIQPIDCDISLEDPSKHRDGPVFTTRLTEKLAVCGDKCCPFGYICAKGTDGSATCQIAVNKAIFQSSSSSSVTSSSTSTARTSATSPSSMTAVTSSPSAGPNASASGIDSTKPQEPQPSNPFPPTVFLAGFFPGMLVGALGVLAWVVVTGRHRKSSDTGSTTSSIYTKKPYISGPIPIDSQSARTEFLRKSSGVTRPAKTLFTKRSQADGTPGLPFDNWRMPSPPQPSSNANQPAVRQVAAEEMATSITDNSDQTPRVQYPMTPERQIYGKTLSRGQETIPVYSPREMEVHSAIVSPLRGMNSRERPTGSSEVGSPFTAPNRTINAQAPREPERTPTSPFKGTYETLTPARYEGNPSNKRSKADRAGQQGRPETTFTAMLEAINFPDPMKQDARGVPDVPKQYRR